MPEKRYVTIELDKPRRLRFDLNALAEIEERLGVGIDKLGDLDMKAKTARVMLWAGLIHEDQSITPEDVGGMVDLDNLGYVQERIAAALAAAGVPGNAEGPKAGSGKRAKS